MGPGGLSLGSYDATTLSQGQRQWLWQQAGHGGEAPVGYGGEDKWKSPEAPSASSIVDTAKQLLQFQRDANKPVIDQLQGQVDPLKQRYSDLLDSIKGQQKVAEDKQTLATNNELASRGILPSSSFYQQNMANALAPLAAQYQGLTAQAGVQEQQDILNIANQVAQLQAGQVPTALSTATGVTQLAQQAQQLAATQESNRQQAALQSAQANYYNALASGKISLGGNDPYKLFG